MQTQLQQILHQISKRLLNAKPDYLFVVWAGANSPWNQIADMKLQEKG